MKENTSGKRKLGILTLLKNMITEALESMGIKIDPNLIQIVSPPKQEMGDFTVGCFTLAKQLTMNPTEVAKEVANHIIYSDIVSNIEVSGSYINFFLDRQAATEKILFLIEGEKENYLINDSLGGKKIMVEFLSPNTNKPLHLGHLRNGVIGTVIANLLEACGASVLQANNINNRGIHIIKSMFAYMTWGNNETPQSAGMKGDHFVGYYYVKFAQEEKKAMTLWKEQEREFWLKSGSIKWLEKQKINPENLIPDQEKIMEKYFLDSFPLTVKTQEMLRQWEKGDPDIIDLWNKMNQWVYDGFDQTNQRLGFNFDRVYYESETYTLGREIIMEQVTNGIGQKNEDESVVIDMSDVGINGGRNGELPVVLIRRDGTSVYITQDIGLAVTRFRAEDDLSSIIYVVAREQELHFKRVFELLKRYGYDWHNQLYHLSYGMVNLPDGKMKSREGTVVDADDLMNNLHNIAGALIETNDSQIEIEEINTRAEAIALGALKFYLLSVSPNKDMTFDPEGSISFDGCTGPYIQYAYARINSIKEKIVDLKPDTTASEEIGDEEFKLVKLLITFPNMVKQAADQYSPSILTSNLYEVTRAFSLFYANCPVIKTKDSRQSYSPLRWQICQATQIVISQGLELLGIPTLEKM